MNTKNKSLKYNILFIIIILLIIIYIKYDLKYPNNFEMIQLTSNKLNKKILFEKQPIVIEDQINDINDFIKYSMNNSLDYPIKNIKIIKNQETVYRNLSNFCYIQNNNKDDMWVYISHPKNSYKFNYNLTQNTYDYLKTNYRIIDYNNINDSKFLKVKLYPKQIIILPKLWLYYIQNNNNELNNNIKIYCIHSIIGFLVSNVYQFTKLSK